jgi:hypothetical protein
MLHRRQFIKTAGVTLMSSIVAQSCSTTDDSYEKAVSKIWRHANPTTTNAIAVQRELVRYATLAASSHNTQCWKFKLENRRISILPDLGRRCPAVDPDDHHLYTSLGCATENLVQAAKAYGLQSTVDFKSADSIEIHTEPTQAISSKFSEKPCRLSAGRDRSGKRGVQCP